MKGGQKMGQCPEGDMKSKEGFVVFVFVGGRIVLFCRKEGFFFRSLHCNDSPLPSWPDFNHLMPGSQCSFISAFAQAFL